MINKRKMALICAFMLIFSIMSGCGKDEDLGQKNIKIAIMGSKEVYDYDLSFLNGIKMAAEDFNLEKNGFTITYEMFDDGYSFETGMLNAKKIVADQSVLAVIGAHSFEIMDSATPIFEKAGKIVIGANGMMDKTIVGKGYNYIFRNCYGEQEMAKTLVDLCVKNGDDSMVVYHSDTEFEKSLSKAFAHYAYKEGVEIVDMNSKFEAVGDFEKNYDRWNALGVDSIFISRESIQEAFEIAKQIRQKDENITIYGDFSFDADEMIIEYQDFAQGIIIPTLVPIVGSQEIDEFESRYYDKFGSWPTWWAVHGYDTVKMIGEAAVKSGSTEAKDVAQVLHSQEGYTGISGDLRFDQDGLLIDRPPVYSVIESDGLRNVVGEK